MQSLDNITPMAPIEAKHSHVIVFTSGKGGVGKTCVATNVAAAMANRGARVCIFDADTGLANINILLGLRPPFTLDHVLKGKKTIHDIVIKTDDGISVVPGASGIAELANLDEEKVRRLSLALTELEADYDYFLIDTGAGVSDSVLQFVESAAYAFLIITSEPTSLTDAFSLLKLLQQRNYKGRVRVVVNQAVDYPTATDTFRRFATAVDKYLSLKVDYGGFIARDESVPKSVALQIPVVNLSANCPASRCLYALADNVMKYIGSETAETSLADYWKNVLADYAGSRKSPTESDAVRMSESGEAGSEQLGAGELMEKLLAAIKGQRTEREDLEGFINQLFGAYAEQFGQFPQIFRQLFFRWLELENYAAPRLLELSGTMEALYMARYQQPLFSLEDSAARVVAQCQGSEDRMRDLIEQLRATYKQSFHGDVFDARQEIIDEIRHDSFSEEQFELVLQQLREAFQARFKRPYRGKSELLLESISDELATMENEEQKLRQEIASTAENFQQLLARKNALLTAIKSNQDITTPFNKSIIDH